MVVLLLLFSVVAVVLADCPKETYWRNAKCYGTAVEDPRNSKYRIRTGTLTHPRTIVSDSCCRCPTNARVDAQGCFFVRSWTKMVVRLPQSCCAKTHEEADPRVVNENDPVRAEYKEVTGEKFLESVPNPPVDDSDQGYSSGRALLQFQPACRSNGVAGVCKEESSCVGTTVRGLCPGPNSIKCCLPSAAAAPGSGNAPGNAPPRVPPSSSGGGAMADPSVDQYDGPTARAGLCPNFYRVWNGYPPEKVDSVDLLAEIGLPWVTNTCTVRFSRAMAALGYKPGEIGRSAWIGKGQRYLIRVQEGIRFAAALFGPSVGGYSVMTDQDSPDPNSPGMNGKVWNPPKEIMGRAGIIHFSECIFSDATGHLDVWDGYNIREHAYFHRCKRAAIFDVCAMKSNPDFSAFKKHIIDTKAYRA